MWLWPPSWGRDKAVPPEEAERVRRHCRTRASAYVSCVRANGDRGGELCARLEAPLLLCYAGRVAPREAAAFQACLTGAAAGSYITGEECAERLEDVKQALRRARLYPEQLAGARTR